MKKVQIICSSSMLVENSSAQGKMAISSMSLIDKRPSYRHESDARASLSGFCDLIHSNQLTVQCKDRTMGRPFIHC